MLDNILYARAYTSESLGDSKLTLTSNICFDIVYVHNQFNYEDFLIGAPFGGGDISPLPIARFPFPTLLNFIQQSNTMNLAMK